MGFFRRGANRLTDADVRRLTRRWLAPWPTLRIDEQDQVIALTTALVDGLRWEASQGFEITDDMRVAIGAHAALLVLSFDDGLDSYLDVTSVIIHPTTIVRTGTRYIGGGLYSDGDDPIIGEAHHQGPVLVSWDAAAQQAVEPWRGESVLLHEFAHRLDMLDGISDGTPPIDGDMALDEWIRVCTETLRTLRRNEEPSVLRQYAATNPAEFFAVATEVFFTRPTALRDENADLYRVLSDYFRQDPARRRPMY